jgi:hypothetical protein
VALLAGERARADYSLFGDAELVAPGQGSGHAASASSDSTDADGFGGISFTVPIGTTVDDLTTLGTEHLVVYGDCGGGSPRFSIRVDMDDDGMESAGDRNIFVYIGPTPNFTGCPAGWQYPIDNLIDDSDLRVDATQVGGQFYDTMAQAKVLVGSKAVVRISLVVDGSWFVDPQTFYFDNVDVNGDVYTLEPAPLAVPADKDDCKDGGWQTLTRADSTLFINQGDCIQYVNTGK